MHITQNKIISKGQRAVLFNLFYLRERLTLLLFLSVNDASSVPSTRTACLCSSLLRCTWKGEIPSSLYFSKLQPNPFSSQYFFNCASNKCKCTSSSFFMGNYIYVHFQYLNVYVQIPCVNYTCGVSM